MFKSIGISITYKYVSSRAIRLTLDIENIENIHEINIK